MQTTRHGVLPAVEGGVAFRKLNDHQRLVAQSTACGCLAALFPSLATLAGKLPAVLPVRPTASIFLLLGPALGMAWVFSAVDTRFWRLFILSGFLAQLPFASYLAQRFSVSLSVWPLALAWVIAASLPELLRHRQKATAELELDPTFFQPSVYRPNPVAVAESTKAKEELLPQRVAGTVLFCDLVNHAVLADNLPPEVWASFLNRLCRLYQETASAHGGRCERNDGEGFRAIFCDIFGVEEHPEAALHSALAIRGRVQILAQECAVNFGLELDVRMGVSTGDFILGGFTPPQPQLVLGGETTDWARLLAGANLRYGTRILISARTGLLGGHSVERRPIDLLQRHPSPHLPEEVFEVLALQHTLDSSTLARLRLYKEGVQFFRARKWAAARQSLIAAKPADEPDEAVDTLLMRIQEQEALASYARP